MNYTRNLNRISVATTPATSGLGFVCDFADVNGAAWAGATYKNIGYRRT